METVIYIFRQSGLALYFIAMIVHGSTLCYKSTKGRTPLYRKMLFASIVLTCSDLIVVVTYGILAAIWDISCDI